MERGSLELIMGNMFAGKTSELIRRIEVMQNFGNKKVIIFKPKIDSRSGEGKIKNFHGNVLDAFDVPILETKSILHLVRKAESEYGYRFNVIAIDEIQFFPEIYQVVNSLLSLGYDVIGAGLRLDFRGEPFGQTLSLIGLCTGIHNITLLNSFCSKCRKPAHLPQRLFNGNPVPYDADQVQVGGNESYEARCYDCHELPGRPEI